MALAQQTPHELPWLRAGDPFPPVSLAWDSTAPAPGLLAAGGALDVGTLVRAYSAGVFPWFSAGQPILWWSPDPRMMMQTSQFKLHRSLRKRINQFAIDPACEIRVDSAFDQTIEACATVHRPGQSGTWIVPDMVSAYQRLHVAGYAHSIETWMNGNLVGGLYCVAIGRAVFGESMFSLVPDASKLALAALIAFCRHHGIEWVDCQQNTRHLASLGARETARSDLVRYVRTAITQQPPEWRFEPYLWGELIVCEKVTT